MKEMIAKHLIKLNELSKSEMERKICIWEQQLGKTTYVREGSHFISKWIPGSVMLWVQSSIDEIEKEK